MIKAFWISVAIIFGFIGNVFLASLLGPEITTALALFSVMFIIFWNAWK